MVTKPVDNEASPAANETPFAQRVKPRKHPNFAQETIAAGLLALAGLTAVMPITATAEGLGETPNKTSPENFNKARQLILEQLKNNQAVPAQQPASSATAADVNAKQNAPTSSSLPPGFQAGTRVNQRMVEEYRATHPDPNNQPSLQPVPAAPQANFNMPTDDTPEDQLAINARTTNTAGITDISEHNGELTENQWRLIRKDTHIIMGNFDNASLSAQWVNDTITYKNFNPIPKRQIELEVLLTLRQKRASAEKIGTFIAEHPELKDLTYKWRRPDKYAGEDRYYTAGMTPDQGLINAGSYAVGSLRDYLTSPIQVSGSVSLAGMAFSTESVETILNMPTKSTMVNSR